MPYKDVTTQRMWPYRAGYVQVNAWVPADLRDRLKAYRDRESIGHREFLERAIKCLEERDG